MPRAFSLAVFKMGKYTSLASSVLMIGVVGGGVLPLVQGGLADLMGSWEWTWVLVAVSEIYLLYYAVAGAKPKASDIQE